MFRFVNSPTLNRWYAKELQCALAETPDRVMSGLRAMMGGAVNIGDTDENADWIKTEENRRTEREIHDRLAEEYERDISQD